MSGTERAKMARVLRQMFRKHPHRLYANYGAMLDLYADQPHDERWPNKAGQFYFRDDWVETRIDLPYDQIRADFQAHGMPLCSITVNWRECK